MKRRLFPAMVLALALPICGRAAPPSAFPVDISAALAPQAVTADGRERLVYELRLTNFSPRTVSLESLEVQGEGGAPLATYRGEALEAALMAVGAGEGAGKASAIGGGRSVVIFLDLALAPGARPPVVLHHRLALSVVGKDGAPIAASLDGPAVTVVPGPAPVLGPPLRGAGWVAANGLYNPDHRRSFVPVDGKAWIAQRFAIDWVRLGPDGRLFHGDPNANTSFYGYGAEVLAVADGRVAGLKDGLPENPGSNTERAVPVTLETIAGDYLLLDLGGGRFALYAHLQPGSLKVKLGDRVKAGQVLALLGNSGNSDAPHLHFHLVDGPSALGAEGVPYELSAFTQTGVVQDPEGVLDGGKAWPGGSAPVAHRREFPVDNAVVGFPERP